MRTELPVIKRCCFCIPLRYGLIVWGYLKLLPLLLYGLMLVLDIHMMIERGRTDRAAYPIIIVICILIVVEIIFNIILIIAAHKKSYKLFKIYYYYILGELALTTAFILLEMGYSIYWTIVVSYYYSHYRWIYAIQMFAAEISFIGICTYITLLVRSEMKKLENENASCNFVNHAAEARCEIVSDQPKQDDARILDLKNNIEI